MRIEFTYTLADIRESRVPERFAARPERYARRWILVAINWAFVLVMTYLNFWLSRLNANSPSPPDDRSYDARIEFAPSVIAALYVLTIYGIAIRKSWRVLQNREALNSPDMDKVGRRLLRVAIVMLASATLWLGLFGTWNLTWHLTATQIVLITLAPWIGLVVTMQILGFVQRRAQTVGVWRSNAGMRRPKTVTIDEAGFGIHDAQYESRFHWSCFERVRETKNLIILVGEGGSQHLIPNRAFADPAELERCRSLLQNAVPNTRFLVHPIGFAVLPKPVLPLPALAPTQNAPGPDGSTGTS